MPSKILSPRGITDQGAATVPQQGSSDLSIIWMFKKKGYGSPNGFELEPYYSLAARNGDFEKERRITGGLIPAGKVFAAKSLDRGELLPDLPDCRNANFPADYVEFEAWAWSWIAHRSF